MTKIYIHPKALRIQRAKKGLNQGQLAEQAHLSRETINRLEKGSGKFVWYNTANALAQALGCTVDELREV